MLSFRYDFKYLNNFIMLFSPAFWPVSNDTTAFFSIPQTPGFIKNPLIFRFRKNISKSQMDFSTWLFVLVLFFFRYWEACFSDTSFQPTTLQIIDDKHHRCDRPS